MRDSGISNSVDYMMFDDSTQCQSPVISLCDSGYAPSFSPSSCSSPPSEVTPWSSPLQQETVTVANTQSRPRGRPAIDWFDEVYVAELRASANGDVEKLKQINNNIASGRYRFNKKMKKTVASPDQEKLTKLINKNRRLKENQCKNAAMINYLKDLLSRRTFMNY
jgi:hypothetical protein